MKEGRGGGVREGRGGRVSEKGGKGRVVDLVEKQGHSTVQYSTVQYSTA